MREKRAFASDSYCQVYYTQVSLLCIGFISIFLKFNGVSICWTSGKIILFYFHKYIKLIICIIFICSCGLRSDGFKKKNLPIVRGISELCPLIQ